MHPAQLHTVNGRKKLAPRGRPYWIAIERGFSIGYRRLPIGGTWNMRVADGDGRNWTKLIGRADDTEAANGTTVFTYAQALEKVQQRARRNKDDPYAGEPPVTVDQALADYRADLKKRGGNVGNEIYTRCHIPRALLAKPVQLLTMRELMQWQNGLMGKMKASSVNRRCNTMKAALNLAAKMDRRITNTAEWRNGLSWVPHATRKLDQSNILSRDQRRAIIAAAYEMSEDFGIFVELHDATGLRTSQIKLINVENLRNGTNPSLQVPCSLKGKGRRERVLLAPIPISVDLAARLTAYSAGRKPSDLLVQSFKGMGGSGENGDHRRPFRLAVEAAGLDPDLFTIYAFRHTKITNTLLKNVPLSVVAKLFDTSPAMIDRTYSKFIVREADAMLRAALVDDDDVAATGNVIPLRR